MCWVHCDATELVTVAFAKLRTKLMTPIAGGTARCLDQAEVHHE